MAGELAEALDDDAACPVCGSLEHPQPATPSDARVSADDIETAVRRRTSADQHQHAVDLQRERLIPLTVVRVVAGPAEADQLSVRELETAIAELQERSHALAARRAELDVLRAGETAALDQARRALAEQQGLVVAAWGDFDSVAHRVEALTGARASLALRGQAASVLAQARQASAVAEDELADLIARRPDAAPSAAPELADRRRILAERVQVADAARAGLLALVGDLRTRIEKAAAAFELRDAVHLRTAGVISLAGMVRGAEGNALAQPLSAYVVQSMFDEVLDVANQRLRAMLDGRFELQATEARTSRKLTGLGLGLEVRDLRTDTVRKTSTLSGGESFCASLALALGLADTVRAHAGGIEIGMLFIDEGFGSLDVDRLDDVMSELTRLQADGRTVGVISHVTEMKRTIQERIDVRVLGPHSGSTLAVSWADS
jgi:exonuclease SbcC